MSGLAALMVLVALPLAAWLTPHPVRFSWGLHHGRAPMPTDVQDRAESFDRYWYLMVDVITIGIVSTVLVRNDIHIEQVGLHLREWERNGLVGVAAGVLLFVLQGQAAKWLSSKRVNTAADSNRRGPAGLWMFLFLAGAFAEEFWIASCLLSIRSAGHSAATAVVLTAIVFGLVHFEYHPGGMLAVALKGVASALLFLWLGSLIPMFLFHFLGNMGSLYWIRRS